jgi:hypothetical protein
MKNALNLKSTLLAAAMLALPVAYAQNITKADYSAGKTRISADYKADKAACNALAGNTKDICQEEAKAKDKVALAELTYSYSGKAGDQTKIGVVKAETAYAVAKERCDDQAGNAKDVCVKEAKAIEVKALVDARMVKKISETKKDGADEKRDADYKVATEKCDALAGDTKSSCISAAKSRFGKM